MNNTITIPVTFEDIRERKPIVFNIGDKVSLKGLSCSGVIIGTNIYGWYGVQSEDGCVCYVSPENLTKVEEKGMREFKVGDVIKNPITNGFAKVLFVSEKNTLIKYIEDVDKGYKHKGSEVLIIKHDLQNFRLANDEWKAYQEQQKAKEESKAVVAILKELAGQIENGELHVFTKEFALTKTRVVGGHAISLKFEGISK